MGSYCTSTALDLRKQVVNNNCCKTSLQLSLFTNKVIWTLSDLKDTPQIIRTLFRSSRHFSDHQDTFQSIWTFFRAFGHSRIFRTLLRLSRHFSDHMDIFQSIWTLIRSSRHFSGHPDTFQIIRTLFRSSRHYKDHLDFDLLDLFLTNQMIYEFSGHPSKTIRICKSFPASIAGALTRLF